MSNGNGQGMNGSEASAPQALPPGVQRVQASPAEAANYALQFLGRAMFNRQERQAFDLAEAMLRAIVSGELTITQGQSGRTPTLGVDLPPSD